MRAGKNLFLSMDKMSQNMRGFIKLTRGNFELAEVQLRLSHAMYLHNSRKAGTIKLNVIHIMLSIVTPKERNRLQTAGDS